MFWANSSNCTLADTMSMGQFLDVDDLKKSWNPLFYLPCLVFAGEKISSPVNRLLENPYV